MLGRSISGFHFFDEALESWGIPGLVPNHELATVDSAANASTRTDDKETFILSKCPNCNLTSRYLTMSDAIIRDDTMKAY